MSSRQKQMIAPRPPSHPSGAPTLQTTGRLPEELLSDHVERFKVFTTVGAGLWTFGLLMDAVVVPYVLGGDGRPGRIGVALEVLGIVGSIVAYAYVRFASCGSHKKADAGLVYMLFNAAVIAAVSSAGPPQMHFGGLSWIAIVILLSSMIMPNSPRKTLVASLAAASMDPLGVWVAHLRGVAGPSAVQTMVLFMPNYACALVAWVQAHAFLKIGHRLRHAQELGAYQLVELLGRGGMGEVWRAKHRLLARGAAIKLVRPELLGASGAQDSTSMIRRFEREAQATAALNSPYTIRVFDFGATQDGTFYYVMELLFGRDLDSLVREFGPVPAHRTIHLLEQACESLAEAHARGLVHRDIKPANIYACRMGLEYDFVKVLDFGLVKFNGRSDVRQTLMTAEHTTTGTPAFMAPEVILGERDVDRRADVYALGCVTHYLLTGQLVFEADTPMKMLMHHVQTPPTPPSQRTELPIPRELDDLVMACLEKDPDKRPQDAGQLLALVRRCRFPETWDGDRAKKWWESHLPELSGPLLVTDATVPEPAAAAAVVVR
jgi:eukaryotic-like serine/threonine-protein kinase